MPAVNSVSSGAMKVAPATAGPSDPLGRLNMVSSATLLPSASFKSMYSWHGSIPDSVRTQRCSHASNEAAV